MSEVLDKDTIKALSTDTRLEIIKLLSKRPYTASELSKIMNKHVTTISEHLDILEKSDMIRRSDNKNKWVYYRLSEKGEKIFKPKFYSWTILLVISFLVVVIFVQQALIFFPLSDLIAASNLEEHSSKISENIMHADFYANIEGNKIIIENAGSIDAKNLEILIDNKSMPFSREESGRDNVVVINVPNLSKNTGKHIDVIYKKVIAHELVIP